jgi:hypothetical protein
MIGVDRAKTILNEGGYAVENEEIRGVLNFLYKMASYQVETEIYNEEINDNYYE